MEIFRERLKELKLEHKLNNVQLAKKIGTTGTTISRWENGSRVPNIESLKKLAMAFDVSADYLLGLED